MINFSDIDNLPKLIDIEKSSLSAILDIQRGLNKQILIFMKTFINNIDLENESESEPLNKFQKSSQIFNSSNLNIALINDLINDLENLSQLSSDILNPKLSELETEYNNKFTQSITSIFDNTKSIESFIHEGLLAGCSVNGSQNLISSTATDSQIPCNSTSIEDSETHDSNDIEKNSFIENTLVISDFNQKVILPYKIDDIQNILQTNPDEYSSIQDVIDKLYTHPFSYYKFAPFARFKEMYKLAKKEKQSKRKALSLATELFFNYNLHPAIITSCNSLDELDIYLACLDDNTLEEFPFFNIKFEIPPAVLPEI